MVEATSKSVGNAIQDWRQEGREEQCHWPICPGPSGQGKVHVHVHMTKRALRYLMYIKELLTFHVFISGHGSKYLGSYVRSSSSPSLRGKFLYFCYVRKIYMYIMFANIPLSFSKYLTTISCVQALWHHVLRKMFIDIKRK